MSAAVRAVRRSAGFSLETIAAATGTNTADLATTLAHIPARGRCSDIAATTAATHTQPEVRTFALTHRTFPPPQTRTVHTTNHSTANPATKHTRRARRILTTARQHHSSAGTATWTYRDIAGPLTTRRTAAQHATNMPLPRWVTYVAESTIHQNSLIRLPAAILMNLASHPEAKTRTVAAKGATTPQLLQILATDPASLVRTAAAANPNCAQRTLQTLTTDPDPSTRASLLNNPSLPKAIARSLLNDPNDTVRSRAQTHPANEFIALEWAAKKLHSTTRRLRRNQRR